MVGVGSRLYGFTLNNVQEELVLCHILYSHYKMKVLNSFGVGCTYCKHPLRNNLDISIPDFAVAL